MNLLKIVWVDFWCEKSKNPNAKRVMIAAHMDEIGFMITNITKME